MTDYPSDLFVDELILRLKHESTQYTDTDTCNLLRTAAATLERLSQRITQCEEWKSTLVQGLQKSGFSLATGTQPAAFEEYPV